MQKTVISTIALKFLKEGTSEFIKLHPLVSKPMPDWLPSQKPFKEALEKELVRISGDIKEISQLDPELVTIAKGLNIPFSNEITQSKLEALVSQEQAKNTPEPTTTVAPLLKASADTPSSEGNAEAGSGEQNTETTDEAELEKKREIIAELGTLGVTANVKWKLETLEAKLVEVKG